MKPHFSKADSGRSAQWYGFQQTASVTTQPENSGLKEKSVSNLSSLLTLQLYPSLKLEDKVPEGENDV